MNEKEIFSNAMQRIAGKKVFEKYNLFIFEDETKIQLTCKYYLGKIIVTFIFNNNSFADILCDSTGK